MCVCVCVCVCARARVFFAVETVNRFEPVFPPINQGNNTLEKSVPLYYYYCYLVIELSRGPVFFFFIVLFCLLLAKVCYPNTKRFKRTLIYFNTDTQSA